MVALPYRIALVALAASLSHRDRNVADAASELRLVNVSAALRTVPGSADATILHLEAVANCRMRIPAVVDKSAQCGIHPDSSYEGNCLCSKTSYRIDTPGELSACRGSSVGYQFRRVVPSLSRASWP